MTKTFLKRRRYGLVCTLVLGLILPSLLYSQVKMADKDLEAVQDDWQARQKIMKSVRYVLKGSTEFRDANLPPGNPIQPRESTLLLDLVNHRFRHYDSQPVIDLMGNRMDEVHKGGYSQMVNTTSYDGKKFYAYRHRDLNGITQDLSDLSIAEAKKPIFYGFDTMLDPIFFAHGYVGSVYQTIAQNHWIPRLDNEYFHNRGYQPHGRSNLLVFTTDPKANSAAELKMGGEFDEYWINRDRQSLIQRYFDYVRGNPSTHLEISAKETPHGWWVDEWTNTSSANNQVERIYHLRVVEMEVNPPIRDSDFVLPAEPGMKVVVDEISNPLELAANSAKKSINKMYRISPTGDWVELSEKGVPVPRTRSTWFWIVALTVVSSLVALVFGILRGKKIKAH